MEISSKRKMAQKFRCFTSRRTDWMSGDMQLGTTNWSLLHGCVMPASVAMPSSKEKPLVDIFSLNRKLWATKWCLTNIISREIYIDIQILRYSPLLIPINLTRKKNMTTAASETDNRQPAKPGSSEVGICSSYISWTSLTGPTRLWIPVPAQPSDMIY